MYITAVTTIRFTATGHKRHGKLGLGVARYGPLSSLLANSFTDGVAGQRHLSRFCSYGKPMSTTQGFFIETPQLQDLD